MEKRCGELQPYLCRAFGREGLLESVIRTQKSTVRYGRLSLPMKPNHLLKLSTGDILQVKPGAQVSAW